VALGLVLLVALVPVAIIIWLLWRFPLV